MADKHQAFCNGGASQRLLVEESSFLCKTTRKDQGEQEELQSWTRKMLARQTDTRWWCKIISSDRIIIKPLLQDRLCYHYLIKQATAMRGSKCDSGGKV